MSRLLSLLLVVVVVGVARSASTNQTQAGPITCFVCWNCLTYEPAVQAKQCEGEGEHFCLVIITFYSQYIIQSLHYFCSVLITNGVFTVQKEELEEGSVNRACATAEKCAGSVFPCCASDRCNTAAVRTLSSTALLVMAAALLAS